MKRIVILVLFVIGLGLFTDVYAQTGGKKRERKSKPRGNRILTQYKSRGHADRFARGSSGRRGKFSRLFHKQKPAWVYKSSGSRRSADKANQFLLTRSRTNGKKENEMTLDRQNRERSKSRVRGNKSFRFKKYRR